MTTVNIDSHAERKLSVLMAERAEHQKAIEDLDVKIGVVKEIVTEERSANGRRKSPPPVETVSVPDGLTEAALWVVNQAKPKRLKVSQVKDILEQYDYKPITENFNIMLSTALRRLSADRINGEKTDDGWTFWAK